MSWNLLNPPEEEEEEEEEKSEVEEVEEEGQHLLPWSLGGW